MAEKNKKWAEKLNIWSKIGLLCYGKYISTLFTSRSLYINEIGRFCFFIQIITAINYIIGKFCKNLVDYCYNVYNW